MATIIKQTSPSVQSNAWFEREIQTKDTEYYKALTDQEPESDYTKNALKMSLENFKAEHRA